MYILNQNESFVVNLDNVETLGVEEYGGRYNIICTFADGVRALGGYVKEERAKEVIKEILKQNAQFILFKSVPAGGEEQGLLMERFTKNHIILGTYEMPKE